MRGFKTIRGRVMKRPLAAIVGMVLLVALTGPVLFAEPPRLLPTLPKTQSGDSKVFHREQPLNSTGAFATSRCRNLFAEAGQWRNNDSMLYLMGLLHCSGEFRIWAPTPLPPANLEPPK
jgi:hypothetical protein